MIDSSSSDNFQLDQVDNWADKIIPQSLNLSFFNKQFSSLTSRMKSTARKLKARRSVRRYIATRRTLKETQSSTTNMSKINIKVLKVRSQPNETKENSGFFNNFDSIRNFKFLNH